MTRHKGLLHCKNCKEPLVSIFANFRTQHSGTTKMTKIDGFAYCQDCEKLFRLESKEID